MWVHFTNKNSNLFWTRFDLNTTSTTPSWPTTPRLTSQASFFFSMSPFLDNTCCPKDGMFSLPLSPSLPPTMMRIDAYSQTCSELHPVDKMLHLLTHFATAQIPSINVKAHGANILSDIVNLLTFLPASHTQNGTSAAAPSHLYPHDEKQRISQTCSESILLIKCYLQLTPFTSPPSPPGLFKDPLLTSPQINDTPALTLCPTWIKMLEVALRPWLCAISQNNLAQSCSCFPENNRLLALERPSPPFRAPLSCRNSYIVTGQHHRYCSWDSFLLV